MRSNLVLAIVCIYGIAKEFRPATPFLTPFLVSEEKGFTNKEVYKQMYPFWTYSYLLVLIPVFILTDRLKYKPVVVLEALSLTATWTLLCFGTTIRHMQIMQIVFGIASASRIAYFSYIYAVVDKSQFKKVTSYIRSSALVGKFLAYLSAQVLILTSLADYLILNFITLGIVSIALVLSLLLPTVQRPKILNRISAEEEGLHNVPLTETSELQDKHSDKSQRNIVMYIISDSTVLIWSIWWALASCGSFQVANYVQSLWEPMQKEGQFVGNGFVECLNTLTSTLLTFSLQYIKFDWSKRSELVFFSSSLTSSLLLYGMAQTSSIWISYLFYIINSSLYQMLMAAATDTIAEKIESRRYSQIFGFNTFLALLLQSILTFTVNHQLDMEIRSQFFVYSVYFGAICAVFAVYCVISRCVKWFSKES
ncbi:unnamed protein product [Bursaphelenchus xylophilus]|uniref:(pine wood nematode) hypothetical protein n=1 Tax=Bursaphelenchus xylophilus TaxID=6326 RepID=A0A1I7S108_BURXY|nr:unnamed protein product [Bursaphelenchus xylophilus]CAG9087981.1 unnamed protein product [Bursaphelenchus xylophilus]